jgi:lysophospholipase L1-like esterase
MAVVLLAVTAVACTGGGSTTVEVVGDSLTFQANDGDQGQDELLAALEREGFEPSGGGIPGMTVESAHQTMWSKGSPDIVVLALGTNDMANGQVPLDAVRTTLSQWLQEVPDACVVLVGVNETTEAWQLHEHGPAYNEMLRQLAAEHGEGHVVDWTPEPQMLSDDGIHLTEEGRAAYRALIVDGVERC